MLRLLRQRNFGLLWFGGLISNMGDWMLLVGLSYEVYRRTNSTLATAGMVIAFLVPSITLGSIAGVFVDRYDRRQLMVGVDIVLAVLLLPLLAMDATGVWIAYVVLIASSCVEQLFQPAQVALVPRLIEGGEADLVAANSVTGVGHNLARLIGPAVGGTVFAFGGLTAVTIADAASFLVSATMIGLIRGSSFRAVRSDSIEHAALSAWRRVVHEWRDGLRVTVSEPVLRAVLFFMGVTRIGEGLTMTLFVPWVVVALHSDQSGYGWLLSTQAIGGLGGAIVIARYASRMNPLFLLVGGAIAFGIIDLGLFTYPAIFPYIGPALVVMVIVGVPGAAMQAGWVTLQQTHSRDSHRGRVIGAISAVGALGSLVGAVLAGILGQVVPVVILLVVQGSGYLLTGLAIGYMTRNRRAAAGRPESAPASAGQE
jgi:predicted MFS family arabinose efflux permease